MTSSNKTTTPTKPKKEARWQIPKRTGPGGRATYCLEGKIKEKFCELYPKHPNKKIMQWFGISYNTLYRFKCSLLLQKDMTVIRKIQKRHMKETCEKNGYYESLRGKRPSQACLDAYRKKLDSGYNSTAHFRATNPAGYQRKIKQWVATMAKLRESDRRRLLFGMEPRTKLVKANPIGRKASQHKCSMIQYCNYFAVREHPEWVCYDGQTRRSARREATAIKHGLKVVEGDE